MRQHWAGGRESVLVHEPGPDSVVRVIAQPLIVAVRHDIMPGGSRIGGDGNPEAASPTSKPTHPAS